MDSQRLPGNQPVFPILCVRNGNDADIAELETACVHKLPVP